MSHWNEIQSPLTVHLSRSGWYHRLIWVTLALRDLWIMQKYNIQSQNNATAPISTDRMFCLRLIHDDGLTMMMMTYLMLSNGNGYLCPQHCQMFLFAFVVRFGTYLNLTKILQATSRSSTIFGMSLHISTNPYRDRLRKLQPLRFRNTDAL